jgi:RNA polymerase sigma factor (sigma-70 family)
VTVDAHEELAARFEAQRSHLQAVAYRMLGSMSEAEDAVQESWLRLSRSDVRTVQNLSGWLTTVVARVCLDMLRARRTRREETLVVEEPAALAGESRTFVGGTEQVDPEHQAMLSDSVGLALLVVLETLTPAERLAFVLHDMFAVPFDEIGRIVGRSTDAAKQLASRARRRVQGAAVPDVDRHRQRLVVDAFLAAARGGDFEALVAILDPDVLLRVDTGAAAVSLIQGAAAVAGQALMFSHLAAFARAALVDGKVGIVTASDGVAVSVMALTVRDGKIAEMDILTDAVRLRVLEVIFLD